MARIWRTPSKTSEDGLVCRPLFIPDDPEWLAIVGGALSELTRSWNWVEAGSLTPIEAAAEAAKIILGFYDEECGEMFDVRQNPTLPCLLEKQVEGEWETFANLTLCPPQVRVGTNGRLQYSTDGGETWVDAPTPAIPAVPPGTGAPRCLAAASAAAIIELTYDEVRRQFNANIPLYVAAAAILAMIALLLGVPLTWAVIGSILTELWALMSALGSISFDETAREWLKCSLYCNSTETSGVVTFDYAAVQAEIEAESGVDPDVYWAMVYILLFIGEEGLNRAGATGYVTEATCDCEDCPETWCAYFDFTTSNGGWIPQRPTLFAGSSASYTAPYWDAVVDPVSGAVIVAIALQFPQATTVTKVEWVGQMSRPIQFDGLYDASNGYHDATEYSANHWRVEGEFAVPENGYLAVELSRQDNTGAGFIGEVTIYGTGSNPFGADNCP